MHILFKVVMFMGILFSGLTQTSKEYFHSLGDTVILLCTLQKETDPIIWGFRFNTTFTNQYSTDNVINPNIEGISGRLSIVGNYDLQISTIRKDDEGTYECKTTTINGIFRQHLAILSIVRPPTDLLIQNVEGGKVSGTEGHKLVLTCTAEGGKPPPEVKLTVSAVGVSVIANQFVQYTTPTVQRNFDRQTVTCTANHSSLSSILNETAIVYLNLKAMKPTFLQTSISTEETVPLNASCQSEGSRPPASFQWYIGSTNVTAFAKDTSSHIQPADTYTVHSTLTYHVNRSYNTKNVTCKVTNIADLIGTQDRRQLDVKYAPDITVNSPTYTENDDTRTVTCYPSGNPDKYTYDKWQHRSKYGEFIREFNGNKTLRLPDAQEVFRRYQDSGEYICTASNGIKDNNNKLNQTGSGYVIVNAQPVFSTDNFDRVKQYGEISKAVEIYVNVYSVPKFTNLIWEREGKSTAQNSEKYESSSTPTVVKNMMHGKEVQLDGYNVTLTIRDLQREDFANYTVTLKSGFSDVSYTIILESATVPETPGNFSKIASSSSTSITVQWDPNSNGGYIQTFYIQYRVQGLLEWTTVSAGDEDINEPKRRKTYEIRNLQEGKAYELRMYSENTAMKRSNVTEVLIAFTDSEAKPPVAAIVGSIAGGLTAIIVVLLLIIFLQKKRKESGTPGIKLRATLGGEEGKEEDGLKDNILYESSQSDGLMKTILYQSADLNNDHSEVTKNQKKPSTSSEYASVQKPNAIYAEVNKVTQPKNAKEKKQKDKKGKPKKTRKEKAKGLNNNPEEEYANSALQLKNFNDGEYANSTDTQGPSGYQTNAQGLEYADLAFGQIPTKDKKQVIHGVDERTIYADVDHTKKAPPPPTESEYEETNIKHGKMA